MVSLNGFPSSIFGAESHGITFPPEARTESDRVFAQNALVARTKGQEVDFGHMAVEVTPGITVPLAKIAIDAADAEGGEDVDYHTAIAAAHELAGFTARIVIEKIAAQTGIEDWKLLELLMTPVANQQGEH